MARVLTVLEGLRARSAHDWEGIVHVGRRRDPYGAGPAAAESRHIRRAESGHHHQVRAADAGDQLPLAAADAALGTGARRYVPSQPQDELLGRGRPGHVRQDGRPRRGDPRRARRTAGPSGLRGPGGARRAGAPLPAARVRGRRGAHVVRQPGGRGVPARPRPRREGRHGPLRRRHGARHARRRRVLRRAGPHRPGDHLGVHGPRGDGLHGPHAPAPGPGTGGGDSRGCGGCTRRTRTSRRSTAWSNACAARPRCAPGRA